MRGDARLRFEGAQILERRRPPDALLEADWPVNAPPSQDFFFKQSAVGESRFRRSTFNHTLAKVISIRLNAASDLFPCDGVSSEHFHPRDMDRGFVRDGLGLRHFK